LWRILLLAFKRRSRNITLRHSVPPPPQTQHTSLTTSLRIISDTSCAYKLNIENLLFTITSTTSCRLLKLPVFYTTNSQTTLKWEILQHNKSLLILIAFRWWWSASTTSIVKRHTTHHEHKKNLNLKEDQWKQGF